VHLVRTVVDARAALVDVMVGDDRITGDAQRAA